MVTSKPRTARDLKIGQRFGAGTKTDDAPTIKVIHEVCAHQSQPHVHVVTSAGHTCLPFGAPVRN